MAALGIGRRSRDSQRILTRCEVRSLRAATSTVWLCSKAKLRHGKVALEVVGFLLGLRARRSAIGVPEGLTNHEV